MLKPSLLEGLFIILGKIYWISTLPHLNTNFIIQNVNVFFMTIIVKALRKKLKPSGGLRMIFT